MTTRLTWLTFRGLVSIFDCDLAKRPGDAGVCGELGTDAPFMDIGFTVPDAVRFNPAVDAPTTGLPGNGFLWAMAEERGTMGVVAVEMIAGGDPGVDGNGVLPTSPLGVMTDSG